MKSHVDLYELVYEELIGILTYLKLSNNTLIVYKDKRSYIHFTFTIKDKHIKISFVHGILNIAVLNDNELEEISDLIKRLKQFKDYYQMLNTLEKVKDWIKKDKVEEQWSK